MKRLFVFVPAILLVVFLFNSFVLSDKYAAKVFRNKSALVNTFFKSTDGGQTWQDISRGLPESLPEDSIRANNFFANDKGLFLKVGNGLYYNTSNATAPFWTKETLSDEYSSIDPGKSGIAAHKYWSVNLQKANETSVWSPLFETSEMSRIGTNFETASGTIFIGTSRGYYRTANDGKTWKHVHAGGAVGHLAESNGVLAAISNRRIIRSTDNGETWMVTTSEDSVAFDVKQIKGGFVAITSNSEKNSPTTSRLSTSSDGGKTWQPIDAPLHTKFIDSLGRTWNTRPSVKTFSTYITQIGENLFSSHPKGISR